METTQKNREAAAPQSAQQRNGAVRSADAQRSAAGRPEQTPERKKPAESRNAARRPEASAEQPARRSAPRKEASGQRRAAPSAQKKGARTALKDAPKKAASPKQPAKKAQEEKASEKKTAQQPRRRSAPREEERTYTHGLPDSVSTKKRAYGNSKPKKKTARDRVNDAVKMASERKAEKIKARQVQREKGAEPRKKQAAAHNTPAVIYTQPQAFNRNRFFMQLLTVTAVVVALVMGLSVFFKVQTITVSGAQVYSTWHVREASGIEEGDNLLTFSHARAGAQIKANLPYVKSVRFGIKLPDTVNIMIEEEDVVYAIKGEDGTWWLMTSSGRIMEQSNSAAAAKYTQVLGVTVTDPIVGERGVATESAAVYETNEQGETVPVPVSVTGAQRFGTALQILQALEENDIVGEATNVDVSRMEDIVLWYGTQYQVNLGNSSNLGYKIACMNDVILQMSEYQSGVLDISFTIWPNQVGYTPFG